MGPSRRRHPAQARRLAAAQASAARRSLGWGDGRIRGWRLRASSGSRHRAPAWTLSTASAYPAPARRLRARRPAWATTRRGHGLDRPVSQDPEALQPLADHHGLPIVALHAPTLLLTQRVWGTDPWPKLRPLVRGRRCRGAGPSSYTRRFAGSATTPAGFAIGVAELESEFGVQVAVENMFPWRARGRELLAYLPHWDPVGQPYEHVTLDLSHTATAGSDALAMAEALGDRLVHLHLADGSGGRPRTST